jgi:hypothetical protein
MQSQLDPRADEKMEQITYEDGANKSLNEAEDRGNMDPLPRKN